MSEEKIQLLMELFDAKDLDMLKAGCPIDLNNWLYNLMDNDDFIDMVKMIDKFDDERIYRELKKRGEL